MARHLVVAQVLAGSIPVTHPMSILKVQCKGSGQASGAGFNAKRARCPSCNRMQDVRSDGKIRKHMRITRTRKLK